MNGPSYCHLLDPSYRELVASVPSPARHASNEFSGVPVPTEGHYWLVEGTNESFGQHSRYESM